MQKTTHMKKTLLGLLGVLLFVSCAWAQETKTTFQILGDVERITYGEERTGGLLHRLETVERDLFGRELPGSITERQNALINFLKNGTQGRPSFLFKLGILEWTVEQATFPGKAATKRVGALEELVEGAGSTEGPLAMRLERMASVLLGDDIMWEETTIPKGTVMKVELLETLNPSSIQPGDSVSVALHKDFTLENVLVAPKGSTVVTKVHEVKPPRSFGRPSEINLAFENLLPLGPEGIPVGIGENSQTAAKLDGPAMAAAAGASVAGLAAFGPLGLVGGLFVRGGGKEIPRGTVFFLETMEEKKIYAYPVPEQLRGLLQPKEILSEDSKEPEKTTEEKLFGESEEETKK